MRGKTPVKIAIGLIAIAMLAAGCNGGGEAEDKTAKTGGELRIYATEPAFLLPSAGNDEPSMNIIRQLYRGLAKYNADTGAPENDLADSIVSKDNKVWTIKLKPGYTFDNGEPVDADAFIRAWNYTAYGPNAQNNAYFMGRIAGINDVSSVDPDGDGPKKAPEPKAKRLSGLKKVDDQTFTVTLTEPFSGLPAVLGYSGFSPMAKACLDDTKACNDKPIGNGPYKIEGTWQHNVGVTLVKSGTWAGEEKGVADKLSYRIFADVNAGYAAFQANEIDVMYTIPPARYKEAKSTYGDHLFEQPGDSFTFVGLPLYNENFKDKRVRQALSLAVDRKSIVNAVFDGRFTPATGLVAPTFEGFRPNACKYCVLDVAKAQALMAEAGGWKGGKLTLWANAGAEHEIWMQAFGDQVKAALGIDYELKTNLQFPEYLDTADAKKFTGPFRLGWGPDYPVVETYLTPLYGTGGSSNHSGYSNKAFDDLIKKGDAASAPESLGFYNQAEDLVLEDMPHIPLWFSKTGALYSDKVDKFVWNKISDAEYGKITLKE